ncbi:hypothetical protein HID58_056959 [Brassica napus]|uniref:K-box domain-containing protein n=2 Tax=Brassica napus TaxID=3708 RepID=A0ABQ8APU0_BRANA|nr:hypothetical protein HID58_056959 [Brassica napus]
MLGEGIDVCSIEELHQLENQLERGLTRIRAKKLTFLIVFNYFQYQLLREEIDKLKEEERNLIKENKELNEKLSGMGAIVVASSSSTLTSSEVNTDGNDNMEVETGLFIGPPEPRQSKKIYPQS